MNKYNVWSLIEKGEYERACLEADIEFSNTQSLFSLGNKVYALLLLEKYYEVILLTSKLIEMDKGDTAFDFIFKGIAYWMLNQPDNAIHEWKLSDRCNYQDASGGMSTSMILYFAAIKLKDKKLLANVRNKINKQLKYKVVINWPGPIGNYLLDVISKTELIKCVSKVPILNERELSSAYFAIAIKELENDNFEGYKQNISLSARYGSISKLDYAFYLAKFEKWTFPLPEA